MPLGSRSTIKDVAARAGVSATTVSYALRGQGSLSQATRDRVLRVAQEMGYVSSASRPSDCLAISVVYPFQHEPDLHQHCIYSAYARGVQAEISKHSGCMLTYVPHQVHGFPLETLSGSQVDGFLTFGLDEDSPEIQRVLEQELPVVLLNHRGSNGASSVSIANRRAMRKLARHLITEHECRNFAFIYPGGNMHSYTRERLLGCRLGLRDSGLDDATLHVVAVDNNPARVVDELLSHQPRFDALMADRDSIALNLLVELTARGMRVPGDLVITGFDDVESLNAPVPITTVRFDGESMGAKATDLLLRLIAGDLAEAQLEVPYELVLRQSCGCIKANAEKE